MEFRQLGGSGLRVPVLGLGTGTFGGQDDEFFRTWGTSGVAEATRLVDVCLDAGVNFFDTANSYSGGRAEEVLGAAIAGRRDQLILSTKATFPMGDGPNDYGSSRYSLIRAVEGSLRRLRTDYLDLLYIHGFDASTPMEEVLSTLDTLVRGGKVRYIGCSNFSGWHLMKSLSISERYGWARYVAYQAYYNLGGREYEWELMPLALDQRVATVAWSPLAGGALSGKIRRGHPPAAGTRLSQIPATLDIQSEHLYRIVETLEQVAHERDKTVAQVALNWILHRPSVSSVIFGARNEQQLRQNLGAVGWKLDPSQIARLDAVSETPQIYPSWHQRLIPYLNPPAVPSAKDT